MPHRPDATPLGHDARMQYPTAPGLAARLKAETRSLHSLAERAGVMADLMHGRLSLAAYCTLLRNLRAIYAALEAGLDATHTDARLWRPELRRLPALEQDLDQLHDGDWRSDTPLARATHAYVERLTHLAAQAPSLLLAHAYLRYLGDLHGGQVLARLIQRQYGLPGHGGTAFYAFGDTAEVEALKHDFRAGLDALPLAPHQADAFVAEACEAFRWHQRMFEELQG
ncbi:biliverdin-producing heme oxygenase [Roseateles puraquae]|uniref:Biliverdin-producing heme oxygenase n=1 Tax=Roseateles puraquae TaxID=431059 RepID=A0A254N7G4_9BURK|nr:biliverdin-producing heme oxygenase [Roseateles puraquae]MDG0855129.1 biliverdin-producing heme oxygenase [Roseateles puraquae]OWR02752.1 biliverdin-producing heme oxygenase [Roseateles puraquae]